LDGLEDALAKPLGLVAVTELASFMLTCFLGIVRLYA
jgi:hypothetical protein